MRKINNTRLFIIFAAMIILSLEANAICEVVGCVFDKDGNTVNSKFNVNVTNTANGVNYPASITNNFYLKAMFSCIIGQDNVSVVAWNDAYYGIGCAIANAPSTKINITLSNPIETGIPSVSAPSSSGDATSETPKCSEINVYNAKQFSIGLCDTGKYYFKNQEIEFKILNIKYPMVQAFFSPMNFPVVLFVNQKNSFDIDKNSADDTSIQLLKISDNKAYLVFENLKEVFPEKPKEPAAESPSAQPAPKVTQEQVMNYLKIRSDRMDLSKNLITFALVLVLIANITWIITQLMHKKQEKKEQEKTE